MRTTLAMVTLVAAATVAAAQSTPRARAAAPAPGTLFFYPERVPQRDGSLATAERGTLFVPVNRGDTARGVIGIDLWRFAAKEPSRLPPIVLLHGGPGWPGLDQSLEDPDYWDRVVGMFTDVTDLVVIGQRGIGSSKPNTSCANSGLPYAMSQTCRAYWEGQGLDLSGFTVVEAAADVRDAAHALGYDSVIVWGGSFGSHWGMTVIRNHPEVVARAVLTGMEGPDHTYDSPTGVWNAIKRYAAEAERSPEVRALFPEGSMLLAIDSIRARLSRGVVRAGAPHPETGNLETMTFNVFQLPGLIDGYTSSIASRSEAAGWPADIYRLYQGDFASVVAARLATASSSGERSYRTASYFMLDCGSGITGERLRRYKNDPAIPYVGDRSAFYQATCPAWTSDLGDAFRANFDTEVVTAIVHGDRDMSTPYENALELAPHFKRGKLVTVVGGSHGALREAMEADEPFRKVLWEFVRTGDLGVLPDSVVLPPVAWEIPK